MSLTASTCRAGRHDRQAHSFELPAILEPLQAVKDDLLVVSGLTLNPARALGDGGGDHARAMASFLTGRHPRKTDGADLRAGVSVDQAAAQRIGQATRFPSLEIGCEGGKNAGECDHGYSCAYQSNLSWRSETTPSPSRSIRGWCSIGCSAIPLEPATARMLPEQIGTTRASSTSSARTPDSSVKSWAPPTAASSMNT